MRPDQTIVAISTPPGTGGIGIVRLSGRESRRIAESLLNLPEDHRWAPWHAFLAGLRDRDGAQVDQVIATWFAAPNSYTAEDVVEVSCHGSPVVLRHAVELALDGGAHLAEPGEFTLRAFLNGRIDLPQAEAIHDLIQSTTLYQARIAAQQMEGSVSRRLAPIKNQIVELIALLEAGIDFAEDDVTVAPDQEILARLGRIRTDISDLAASFAYGKLVHDGAALAIVGRPNVGKSSLFNRLLRQDRAIVTEIAGTTRDTVSEHASLDGIPVRLVDTAGIRSSNDVVESQGIERSFQAMADADLTMVVVDASAPLEAGDRELMERAVAQGAFLVVGNKCDLPQAGDLPEDAVLVSALDGSGLEDLRARLRQALTPAGIDPAQPGFITSLRHERLLRESVEAVERAAEAVGYGLPHEMLLLDIYAALRPVDSITGATTADDILNRIFSTFCIGK